MHSHFVPYFKTFFNIISSSSLLNGSFDIISISISSSGLSTTSVIKLSTKGTSWLARKEQFVLKITHFQGKAVLILHYETLQEPVAEKKRQLMS